MTPSQTRTAAAKIARDFSASAQCSAFPHSRQTADEIARMIETMPVPDEPLAIDGLAEDMAKALEQAITAIDDWLNIYAEDCCGEQRVREAKERVYENGTLWYIATVQAVNRAVLDHFNAAKKEQA